MVCCAAYWRRHEIDEAGVVGTKLQKILFFLSALTAVSLATFEPTTVLCGLSGLLLYAVGLIGAQKRDVRYLWTYGAVSVLIMVLSFIFASVLTVLVLGRGGVQSNGDGQYQYSHPMFGTSKWPTAALRHGLVTVEPAPNNLAQHGVYVAPLAQPKPTDTQIVDLLELGGQKNAVKFNNKGVYVQQKRQAPRRDVDDDLNNNNNDNDDDSSSSSDADVDADGNARPHHMRLAALGWLAVALAAIVGVFVFVLKVQTIVLAFRMRKMLLALASQRLPVSMPAATAAATTTATSAVVVSSAPAPVVRRDCERCTFVNATGVARCAMCDSPLPLVAAPVSVTAPPKIYQPGALYPMNSKF